MSTVTHYFRLGPDEFSAMSRGVQRAVVAQSALGIEEGDQLVFREWRSTLTASAEHGAYTGQWIVRKVLHALPGGDGTGIAPDHLVLSLNLAIENDYASLALKRELNLAERQGVSPDRYWRVRETKEQGRRGTVRDVLPLVRDADDGLETDRTRGIT